MRCRQCCWFFCLWSCLVFWNEGNQSIAAMHWGGACWKIFLLARLLIFFLAPAMKWWPRFYFSFYPVTKLLQGLTCCSLVDCWACNDGRVQVLFFILPCNKVTLGVTCHGPVDCWVFCPVDCGVFCPVDCWVFVQLIAGFLSLPCAFYNLACLVFCWHCWIFCLAGN